MTAPLVTTESRRDRLRRRAAEDLEHLEAERRGDPLRRYRAERDAERAAGLSQAAVQPKRFWEHAADFENALRAERDQLRDPFFPMAVPAERSAANERPLGPTPRGGMRPGDPDREAERIWEQAKNRHDPFRSESQAYRTLAHLRYKSPLAPLVFGPGQTVARAVFRGYDALHALPWERLGPGGELIDRGLGALEQDLGSRLARDEAQEYVVRERYMTPAERLIHDLLRFGVEFETAGRIAPVLKARPAPLAAPEGAGILRRLLTGTARVGRRSALEGAQFGSFEMGKSLLAPRLQRPPPPRRRVAP